MNDRARTPRSKVRGLPVVLAVTLAAALLAVAGERPAWGVTDGPPSIGEEGGPVPQIHRPPGGGAVRIYGERLLGTTGVTIGGVAAPDFRVVDGDLIIATVPPAAVPLTQNDGFAHVKVTDDEGTSTTDLDADGVVDLSDCTAGCTAFGPELGAVFYTDANLTLSPSTGLDGGETTTATLTGHRPSQGGWPFVHLNPLGNFLEDGPLDPDNNPPGPPYGAALAFAPTDPNGNTAPTAVQVAASPTFNAKDQDYDADADCPVAQVTANHGLDRCIIGYTEFGMASMETRFGYSPDAPNLDPVPAAPTLTLTPNAGPNGTSVAVNGSNWSAAPHFGSDTTIDDPGESALIIDVCNVALTSCAAAGGPDAGVGVTRYFDGGPEVPDVQPVTPVYTGATLSGSFTANTAGCTPNCVVRVRQQRYDIEANALTPGAFITATAPFPATTNGGGSTAIGNATLSEGNSGQALMSFTVTRTGGSGTTTFGYATGGGSATPGSDYASASGTASISGSSTTITVPVKGDTADEPNETFNVGLFSPSQGTISDATGLGTIFDDDLVPGGGSTSGGGNSGSGAGQTINGSSGSDNLVGTAGDDIINCGAGNDKVDGRGGNDVIRCGAGNDKVSGGAGNDRIDTGKGNDQASGGAGKDRMSGSSGNDKLAGNAGADTLSGGKGNDRLSGNSGNDRLSGGDGRDRMSGGEGRDQLKGGRGRDRLNGGRGRDREQQ